MRPTLEILLLLPLLVPNASDSEYLLPLLLPFFFFFFFLLLLFSDPGTDPGMDASSSSSIESNSLASFFFGIALYKKGC